MVQIENSKKWLAIYIYYAEPWEKLLVEAVKPFTENVLQNGLAEQFFFIRYWERGPHIRLRFKGETAILENKLKPRLTEHFKQYFEQNLSKRSEPKWAEDTPEKNKWYPNNSIQFVDYKPETERYGGSAGIKIAERQFEASSKAILAIIEENLKSWDYTRALGAAIQLHLGFAYALGMKLDEMSIFFTHFFENWLPRAYYFFEKEIPNEEIKKRKLATLNTFKKNLKSQQETLFPFIGAVWAALNEGQGFEQEWLNIWVADMKKIRHKLNAVQKDKNLIPPEWYMQKDNGDFPIQHQERWAIYDSYVHMINNRLGINNRDEAYLSYLLVESIKQIQKQSDEIGLSQFH